jgi:hypothetical protein
MNISPRYCPSSFVQRIAALVCAALLLLQPTPHASAALLPGLSLRIVTVSGSAVNTITSLTVINDVTLAIEAESVGHLTHFGNFTGQFSYLAIASPVSIALLGNATLTNDDGDQLFLAAAITELGTDYPYALNGALTITGGTGRFAGSTGTLLVSGTDEESPSDTVQLAGTIITLGL